MARAATSLWRKTMRQEIDPSGILNALPDPVSATRPGSAP